MTSEKAPVEMKRTGALVVAERAEKVATRTTQKVAKIVQEKVALTAKEELMQMYLKEAATRTAQKEMAKKDTNAGTRRMEEALRNQGPHDGWNLGREAS